MLSTAKVRIHGMQDDNWVIKDKINQYRGLIKLYGKLSFTLLFICLYYVYYNNILLISVDLGNVE